MHPVLGAADCIAPASTVLNHIHEIVTYQQQYSPRSTTTESLPRRFQANHPSLALQESRYCMPHFAACRTRHAPRPRPKIDASEISLNYFRCDGHPATIMICDDIDISEILRNDDVDSPREPCAIDTHLVGHARRQDTDIASKSGTSAMILGHHRNITIPGQLLQELSSYCGIVMRKQRCRSAHESVSIGGARASLLSK